MSLIINLLALGFVVMGLGLAAGYFQTRERGILLAALAYGGTGLWAFNSGSILPLLLGFGAAWMLRLAGLDQQSPVRDCPVLLRFELGSEPKTSQFLRWWLEHDRQVRTVRNPGLAKLWAQGYRPITEDPDEGIYDVSPEAYFMRNTAHRLALLRDGLEGEFRRVLESSDNRSTQTLMAAGEIAHRYNLQMERFVLDRELQKIPTAPEREAFKVNYLTDTLVSSELRIVAWLYLQYFDKKYSPAPLTPSG